MNTKNKQGFTLIELLAVIIILGVIAMIAVPTVNTIIKDSKEKAFAASIKSIISSAQSECELEKVDKKTITNTYTFNNGVVTPSLALSGTVPDSGTLTIDDSCKVKVNNVSDGTYCATKDYADENATISEDCPEEDD